MMETIQPFTEQTPTRLQASVSVSRQDESAREPVPDRLIVWALHSDQLAIDEIHAGRQSGQLPFTAQLTSSTLKHADDQALAALLGLAAVWPSQSRSGIADPAWGIVACPLQPGYAVMQAQTARFREQGPWCVSPHIIPNFSLHSLAGLLSIALQLNGPNIGVSGVAGREAEVFTVAYALLRAGVPGLWLVWTAALPEDRIGTLAIAVTAGYRTAQAVGDCPAYANASSDLPAPQGQLQLYLGRPNAGCAAWADCLLQADWTRPHTWDAPGLGSIAWQPASHLYAHTRAEGHHTHD